MRSFAQLLVATAFTGAFAQTTQYFDGYENVNSATDPVQIRLAYQGPTAMMVSWNTFQQLPNPTVAYGTSPNALTLIASSSVSVTYATSLTYNNHVNITGLKPFTTYYYLPQYSNATTPYSFTTARLAGDTTPYTVGVVVDMGTFGALGLSTVVGTGAANPLAVNEQTTIAALTQAIGSYEHIIHAGDIAYADYWLKEEIQNYLPTTTTQQGAVVYESILNAFYDELEGLTSSKAYMVAAGNHEANCDNGGTTNSTSGQKYTSSICLPGQTNFTGYINHWRMPSGPSNGVGNFWYSYDYGMTHYIIIDTETDLGNGLVGPDEGSPEFGGPFGSTNQQINWLTADLASVNRTVTPWIVVFGHRGWYLSASGSVCANCQTAFESIFHKYDVDVYINGHAHIYERAAPTYNNVIDPNGLNNPSSPLYLTNGAAGHYDGLDKFTAIQPYSVYRQSADYCWTSLTFTNSTHMTLNSMWSANNTVFDSATLIKNHVYSSTGTSSTSSSSTSTAFSSASTNPTATTNTATTTSTANFPTYTNFNGQGHLYIYYGGILEGDIGSAGTWYNAAGQNTATYTAVPLYPNGTAFTLQHSTSYCTIGSDYSFACAAAANGATIFGQTADGELTFNGSPSFYAPYVASSSSRPTIYATPMPAAIIISWGTGDAASTLSMPSSTSAPATTTSGSSTSSSSSIATATSTSSSSSTGITSISGSSSPAVTGSATVSVTVTTSTTTTSVSISDIFITTTTVNSATVTSTEIDSTTETDSVYITATEIDSVTLTQATTSTEIDPTTIYQTSTETDVSTATLPAVTSYITSTSVSISYITLPAVTITSASTETDAYYNTATATTSLPAVTSYITLPATTVSTCPAPVSSKYVTAVTTLTSFSTIIDIKTTHTTTVSLITVSQVATTHTTSTTIVSITQTETKHTTTTSLATVTDYKTTHTTSTITLTSTKTP